MKALVQAFLHVRRQEGWRSTVRMGAQSFLSPLLSYRRAFLLRRSLSEPISIPSLTVDVAIRQITLDGLALLETILPSWRVKRLARKMQAGEICFVAVQEQRVVAYLLAGFANTPSTEDAQLKLGPQEAYLWGAYALPEFRRQGVVGALNLSLCSLLRDRGYEYALLLVDRSNRAVLGHCYKIGYHVTDRVVCLSVLGWKATRHMPSDEPARGRTMERVS